VGSTLSFSQRLRERMPVRTRVLLGLARRELRAWKDLQYLAPTLKKVQPFSMVYDFQLIHLGQLVRQVLAQNIPGDFVECGVWRGGASFLMADLLRRARVPDRKVWLFDSFEGLPPPEEVDGAFALSYFRNPGSPWYHDNCRVAVEDVRRSARDLGIDAYTELVKGWFDETLPANRDRIGSIALLRLDCDWYKSVRCCLDTLYDQVSADGIVLFDDYYAVDGCAIAVHEFLASRRLPHRLETQSGNVFFRKSQRAAQ